jgi:hypothetical protein
MRLRSALIGVAMALDVGLAAAVDGALQFNPDGELVRPANYREWPFLTSGLGMVYGPNASAPGRPAPFSNVFVSPDAYRAFMQSGEWPNGTVFVLEIRRAIENASINNGGRTQGSVVAIEASVKDTSRFPEAGWAYFSFDGANGLKTASAPLPRSADCYACHSKHGAVEWTFTQFYPEQFEVAQRLRTVRADFDPARKAQ